MAKFSQASTDALAQVHPKLVQLATAVIQFFDFTVINGIRTVEQQQKNVAAGLSQTMDSKHLPQADGLSHAIDAAPYPQHWDDAENAKPKYTPWQAELFYFGGFMKGYAAALGIPLRYGGDFNRNNDVTDSHFEDLDHFELDE